ncbi:hypothetical protein GCM10010277_76330 [Streptomyces longisporoflavus]|nr:hypothetical protein GCM10010277_76330 [Streptomyces longisporoflavus]
MPDSVDSPAPLNTTTPPARTRLDEGGEVIRGRQHAARGLPGQRRSHPHTCPPTFPAPAHHDPEHRPAHVHRSVDVRFERATAADIERRTVE